MYLRKTTFILCILMTASFSARLSGTLFPQIFNNLYIVKAAALVHIGFISAHLLFWLFFYREYIAVKKKDLKLICLPAVIGSFAVFLIYLKKILTVFDSGIPIPSFIMNPRIDVLLPLICAVLHLIFFIYFKRSLKPEEQSGLHFPVISVIGGISIFIGLHSMVLLNFVAADNFKWREPISGIFAFSTVSMIGAAACMVLFFYYRFYLFLGNRILKH